MPTVAGQRGQIFGIFAEVGTVLRPGRRQTLTRLMRTLVALSHFRSPRSSLAPCAMPCPVRQLSSVANERQSGARR